MNVKNPYLKILEYLLEDNHLHHPQKRVSQSVITERGGCSRCAVSKHIKSKVDWKE